MTMKAYSKLLRAPKLEPHQPMMCRVIRRTLYFRRWSYPSAEYLIFLEEGTPPPPQGILNPTDRSRCVCGTCLYVCSYDYLKCVFFCLSVPFTLYVRLCTSCVRMLRSVKERNGSVEEFNRKGKRIINK